MQTTKPDYSLLKLLTGLVMLTTGLVAISLLSLNPQNSEDRLVQLARAPASLVSMALNANAEPQVNQLEHTAQIHFDCQIPTETKVEPEVRHLRIEGSLCWLEKGQDQVSSLQIQNSTNGYTATIFQPGPSLFTSDFIHLESGRNRLVMSYKGKSGLLQQKEFWVVR